VLAKLAERGDVDPGERVVLVITGDGLKTLDAVRDTFTTYEIEPTVESFDEVAALRVADGSGGSGSGAGTEQRIAEVASSWR
jgi:threonine synthase